MPLDLLSRDTMPRGFCFNHDLYAPRSDY
jgi:hypothetical protein